jgi:hypothetical protein
MPASADAVRPKQAAPARKTSSPAGGGSAEAGRSSVTPAVSYTAPDAAASPFEEIGQAAAAPARRRKNPNVRAALVVSLLLFLLSGAGVAVYVLRINGAPAGPAVDGPGEGNPAKAEVANAHFSSKQRHPAEVVYDKSTPLPRRALLISVHNYLFANPVGTGLPTRGARHVSGLPDRLANGLRIPRNQIAHLSDAAARGEARPPLKGVIEDSLTKFLHSSRPQDRVLVFFIGHAVDSGGVPYLVPLEGELDAPDTLIPLPWVFAQLAECPARQKFLVLDVCRLDPVAGTERPGGEAMTAALAGAINTPPPGLQVWSACGLEQHSYETERAPMGVFLDALQTGLERASDGKLQLQEHIQRPDDPVPLERLKVEVDADIAKDLGRLKLAQATLLTGSPPSTGAAFDPTEPAPRVPELAAGPKPLTPDKRDRLAKLLADVAAPAVKPSAQETRVDFSLLPWFDEEKLAPYLVDSADETDLQKTVRKTQSLLYAVAGSPVPPRLADAVKEVRKTLKGNLTILRDGYRAPRNESQFKNQVMNDERDVARIMAKLTEAHEELQAAGEQRAAETKRWKANYDFMLARLEAEIAYLFEYQSMLGQMRKELPPRDAELHGGWKLAATTSLTGDSQGKKMASSSRKRLDRIIQENPGTPWEVLARREKLTALGLEWKPSK